MECATAAGQLVEQQIGPTAEGRGWRCTAAPSNSEKFIKQEKKQGAVKQRRRTSNLSIEKDHMGCARALPGQRPNQQNTLDAQIAFESL